MGTYFGNNFNHYYNCNYSEGHFFNGTIASAGFHDFTAQANVLKKFHKKGFIYIHKGICHND